MIGVNDRQLLPRLSVQRMLLQMLHAIGGHVFRVGLHRLQMLLVAEQAKTLHAFGYDEFPALMRRQQHFHAA